MTGSRYSFFAINPLGPNFEVFSAGTLWARLIKKNSKNGQTGSKRAPLGGARTYGSLSFSKMLVM
jgi:hypothetical protein